MKFTKLDYSQYLLSSQINYTMTNLADHLKNISHDKINYYLNLRDCHIRWLVRDGKFK